MALEWTRLFRVEYNPDMPRTPEAKTFWICYEDCPKKDTVKMARVAGSKESVKENMILISEALGTNVISIRSEDTPNIFLVLSELYKLNSNS